MTQNFKIICIYLNVSEIKRLYTSITVMIVSNIYRLQCANGVLLGKMVASKSKWI